MKKTLSSLLLLFFIVGGITISAQAGDAPRPPFPIQEHSEAPPALSGCGTAFYGESDEPAPPGELILIDTLVLRPLGIVALGIGAVGGLVSMPFALMTNSCDRVQEALIERPFHYTFTRPLGEMDH